LKLNKKKINEIYIQAGKYERSKKIKLAIKLYRYLIDKYPDHDLAIKSNDRLLAIKDEKKSEVKKTYKKNKYNPCKHVYVGKSFEGRGFLGMRTTYIVLGFSSNTGKATICPTNDKSYTQEIYCSQIPY